jgi:Tol biopolymer transport system component
MRGLVFIVACCVPLGLAQATANSSSLSASDKIVFVSTTSPGGHSEVFVVNLDGSQRLELTRNTTDDLLPAWSPDHARIAFARKAGRGKPSIWVMTASGANQHRLRLGTHPSWSPSGSQLVFARDGVIYTMNDRGRRVRRITKGTHPVWAPRGRRIAFERGTKVFLANVDTRAVRLLTSRVGGLACDQSGEGDPVMATLSSPEWAPAGSRLVVSLSCTSPSGHSVVAKIISARGSGVIRDLPIGNLLPASRMAWSPDGTRLAFGLYPDHGIATAKLDGTDVTTVTSGAWFDLVPDW